MAANGSTDQLNARQKALLAEMLQGKSVEQAARGADIPERTAYRWAELAHFRDALECAHEKAFAEKLKMLRTGTGQALTTIARIMVNQDIPPAVQLRAAQCWLENAIQVHRMEGLEKEIAELKQLLLERGVHG